MLGSYETTAHIVLRTHYPPGPAFERATAWLTQRLADNPRAAHAGATPYLHMAGYVLGGYLLAKGAVAAKRILDEGEGDDDFLNARILTARFFVEQLVPRTNGLFAAVTGGDEILFALTPEQLSA